MREPEGSAPAFFGCVNTGSSSVRVDAVSVQGASPADRVRSWRFGAEADPNSTAEQVLREVVEHTGTPFVAIAHRWVHGGPNAQGPERLTEATREELQRWRHLAPLHTGRALSFLDAFAAKSSAPQWVVYDADYFRNMPLSATTIPVPLRYRSRPEVRRYGFHGLAHQNLNRQLARAVGQVPSRVVSLQLGSGCSAAMVRDGVAEDSTMGFSPLEGLPMATRSGSLDPALVMYLLREEPVGVDVLARELLHESGWYAIGGHTSLSELVRANDPNAELAFQVLIRRVLMAVGGFATLLGGLDAVVLGGGAAENVPELSEALLNGLGVFGVRPLLTSARPAKGRLSHPDSEVEVWLFETDEAEELARAVSEITDGGRG